MKEQADNIILESLNYSKRMLASVISVIIFIIGIAFIISPLFLVSQSYIWTLGLIIVAIAILYIYTRKKRDLMKATNRAYHLSALALQGIALILEILPIGTVMVFATSPTKQTIEVYSYFSLLPVGYANFTPLLTGILTILIILLGAIALFKFDNAASLRKAMFVCSVISLLLSIVPLFLFGTVGMTAASYAVSCAILLSICYLAKAGTKVVQPVPPRSAASFSSERVNK